ncbi:hypothetical protein [Arthrobacter sp. JCM 19049]|uniref:hypothetical protein n=1 Tax=Arthrobacter sp. JCM 19049 TaxID=1460643 RepID=UPI0006D14CCA|nr:hypothetical protein [Arthrobacter sp. JCM 19049]
MIAMLIGAVALFIGIGQKTFWAPPETVTATMPEFDGSAPLTVIEPSINDADIAPVELQIESEGQFTASLGRSYDVEAWVGDAKHVSLTGIDRENHRLQAELVDGKAEVPNPAGGDIFFDSQQADGKMTYRWTAPDSGSWSLLLAADGKQPAPAKISVTYANTATMPWALPLIIIGSLLIVVGLAFLLVRPAAKRPARRVNTHNSLALVAALSLGLSGVLIPAAPSDESASPRTPKAQPPANRPATRPPSSPPRPPPKSRPPPPSPWSPRNS